MLVNYDLIIIEDPVAASSARISVDTREKMNLLRAPTPPAPVKGWRTVDVGFRMTIPSNWQKEKVYPIDSNCGTYTSDKTCLDFDEVHIGYTAERAQAAIDKLKKKEADKTLLNIDEEIWRVRGRIADFRLRKTDASPNGPQPFSNIATLVVPYSDKPGYLSIRIQFKSEDDLPTVRRVLKSVEWPATETE